MTLPFDARITSHGLFEEPLDLEDQLEAALDQAFGPLPPFYADLVVGGKTEPDDGDSRR